MTAELKQKILQFNPVAEKMVVFPYLTVADVSKYLQLGIRTVYQLIYDGELPAIKHSRGWRVRIQDVDAYMEKHIYNPQAENSIG